MPDKTVSISYEAFVKGLDKIQALSQETENLQKQNDEYQRKLASLSKEHERHDSVLLKARHGIIAFRKELFAISFTAAAVIGTLKLLSVGSEEMGARMEKAGDALKNWASNIGSFLANNKIVNRLFGESGVSRNTRIDILGLQADTARLQGDELTSLMKRQEAERIKLLEGATASRKKLIESELEARQAAEREAFRLAELGLKNLNEIARDMRRDIVGAFKSGTSDTVFNFLQGEHQTGKDVLKNFMTGINRAMSDAFSNALFTTFATGGNFFENFKNILTGRTPSVIAAEKTAKSVERANDQYTEMLAILKQIAECTCATASRIPNSINIEPAKKSGLQKVGDILGMVGGLASLGAGSIPTGTPTPVGQIPADIKMDPSVYMKYHSGGVVQHFDSGGEVSAKVLPGEFVVRRAAAQGNKDLLKDINSGARRTRGTTNVFLINANDAKSFADQLANPSSQAQMEVAVIKRLMSNGQIRDIIKNYAR